MSKLKVLSLFAGIGGFDLGLERTGGFETVAFCEIDKDCQKVLRKHWPDVPIFNDVTKLDKTLLDQMKIKDISLLCGGYPCTGHSIAGKKEGFKNEASGLWGEYLRIIEEIKPKYIIIENSANLRNTGLTRLLKDIQKIGHYDLEYSVCNGYSVGAPHQRERIYIVCWRRELPYCDPFRPWRTNIKEEEIQSFWGSESWTKGLLAYKQRSKVEPSILRANNDVSRRLDENRIKQLGNAVVPIIPQLIGEQILKTIQSDGSASSAISLL